MRSPICLRNVFVFFSFFSNGFPKAEEVSKTVRRPRRRARSTEERLRKSRFQKATSKTLDVPREASTLRAQHHVRQVGESQRRCQLSPHFERLFTSFTLTL